MARKSAKVGAPALEGQDAQKDLKAVEDTPFPRQLSITNNTPMRIVFAEVGLDLIGNQRELGLGEKNTDTVVFKDADQFKRFESEVESLATRFKWVDAVTVEEMVDDEPEAPVEPVPPADDSTNTGTPGGDAPPVA